MAWQDRGYYRDRSEPSGSPLIRALWWLGTGSIPLFTAFGIRVRAHAAMLVFIGLMLLLGGGAGMVWQDRVVSMTMLFGVVLLHEFGHCFAARWMGGSANDILMWPLGGLAFTSPPRRPWPSFVTTAAGPMVNVVICLICGVALYFLTGGIVPLNPFRPLPPVEFYLNDAALYFWWLFTVSYILLLFNLLPIFPLDGGRMLQEALWGAMGYYRSMIISARAGMVGAVIMGLIGLLILRLFLVLLAIMGFMYCRQQLAMMQAGGPWSDDQEDEPDYASSLYASSGEQTPTRSQRAAARRLAKLQEADRRERQKVDAILMKVSASGMHSLTWWERRTLRKATEHQRQRDAEMARARRRTL